MDSVVVVRKAISHGGTHSMWNGWAGCFWYQEIHWACANSITCAPSSGHQMYPAPDRHGSPQSCLSEAHLFIFVTDCQRDCTGRRLQNKVRPKEEVKEREGSFCPMNKPCMPNFTLILSLAALPFHKYWVWEKQKEASAVQGWNY